MNRKERLLIITAAIGIELCWIAGVSTTLIYYSNASQSLFWQPPISFFAAFLITALVGMKRKKKIFTLAIFIPVFILLMLNAAYLAGSTWPAVAGSQQSLQFWITAVTAFSLTIISCASGYFTAVREHTYYRFAARFDLGILIFVTLLIITGILAGPTNQLLLQAIIFFIISLPALLITRYIDANKKGAVIAGKGNVTVFHFTVIIITGGITASLLLYPLLTAAADTGYSLLDQAGRTAVSLFSSAILFIYSLRRRVRIDDPQQQGQPLEQDTPGLAPLGERDISIFEQVFALGSLLILSLIILAAAGFIIKYLYIKYVKEDGRSDEGETISLVIFIKKIFHDILHTIKALFRQVGFTLNRKKRMTYLSARDVFYQFLQWGKRSGLDRRDTETAAEYTKAISHLYPGWREDFDQMLQIFHDEIYGEQAPDKKQLLMAKKTVRKLYSPLMWPPRLRTRLSTRK